MSLSNEGIEMIHLIAIVYTLKLAEILNCYSEKQPLRDFEKRREREKKIFIAKLTNNDSQMDIATSENFAIELIQFHVEQSKTFAKEKFKDLMMTK